ncbi:MAG: hypothetical protein IVW36_00865 [Dehalococcoidia bacterium]|nr:hypothetical protein [Dehalococcoidia bacterium]
MRDRDVAHPLNPRLPEILAASGGLDITFRDVKTQLQPELPVFVPRVLFEAQVLNIDWPALALPLDRIATSKRLYTRAEAQQRLHVAPDTKLIVTGFQRDDVLELRWARIDALASALGDAGYDLVTVSNLSLWLNDTRLEHRSNIARTIRWFEAFAYRDVITRPHVSFFLNRDVDDWIAELRRWPDLHTFSLDFATFRTDAEWYANLARVQRLFDGIGPGYDVLVNGVAKSERIAEVGHIIDRFTLVNETAYHHAMSRHVTREELSRGARDVRSALERGTIFRHEVERTTADVRLATLRVPSANTPSIVASQSGSALSGT